MKKELTLEEKIIEAADEVKADIIEKHNANKTETEIALRKSQAHFKLQKSKERLAALERESELMK